MDRLPILVNGSRSGTIMRYGSMSGLSSDLPSPRGDRAQLQRVVLTASLRFTQQRAPEGDQ
jgi:hypothetical protein